MATLTATGVRDVRVGEARTVVGRPMVSIHVDLDGVTVDLHSSDPDALQQLADAVSEAAVDLDELISRESDGCTCQQQDMPLFDHSRSCLRRRRAERAAEQAEGVSV